MSWNKPSNGGSTITRYRVRYGTTCSGSSNVYTTGANSTSTTLSSGISNGTRYYVKVQARNSKGYGLYSSCFSATPQASASKPSAPSAPSLSAGDGSIAVSWNKPSNGGSTITRYRVRYGTTCSGSSNVYTTGANSTSTTLSSGISNGTRYYVKVQARNSKGYGLYSSCFSATPQASASKPSAPSAPSLSAGDGSIAVSWNKPSNGGSTITRYRVRCGTTCSGSSNVYTYSANSTSKTLSSGISNGTRYYVKVQARNSQGYGPYSSCSSATPQASVSAPSAPSVPSLNPGNGSIVVSWGAPGDNGAAISDYRVAYGTACSAGSSTVTTGDGTVTSKTLTSGIANGTVYYVKVQARNSQGWGSYSVCASATPSGAVDSPALKAVYNSTGGDAWTNNTNWNDTSLPLKDWHGVNTDSRSRVNYINLNDNNLTGVVPEQIGDLANLVTLWLGKNKLTEIHTDISQATSLNTLGLTDNNLTAIPATIGQLPVLVNLYLKSNNLTTIPATIGAPSENQIEKPSNHTLEKLNLADNKLTSIPDNIGNLANLTLLRLDDNPTLNTPLPDTFTGLVKLKTLNTTNTNLCIPAKLKNWTSNNTNWYTHLHTNNNLPYCTAPTAPTAPTIATTNTAGELTVTWNPPTNTGTPDTITGYDLQHRTGTTGTWTTHTGTWTTTRTLTGLADPTTTAHQTRIRARNAYTHSPWSPTTTHAVKPTTPTAPTLTPHNTTITAQWTTPHNGGAAITQYKIRTGTTCNTGTTTTTTNTNTTTIDTLTPNTTYHIQIQAKNVKGHSPWGPCTTTTTTNNPTPTLTTNKTTITEPPTPTSPAFAHTAWITITLDTTPTTPTTINYTITGTATPGTDYTLTPNNTTQTTIPPNTKQTTITITAKHDNTTETNETIKITLTNHPTQTTTITIKPPPTNTHCQNQPPPCHPPHHIPTNPPPQPLQLT